MGAPHGFEDFRGRPVAFEYSGGIPAAKLQVVPFYPTIGRFAGPAHHVKAAVWINANSDHRVCSDTLGRLYSLTDAESDIVARLVEGYTQGEIAELRSVSNQTIRTQVKSAMAKVGVSRQADLIRIVLCGPAGAIRGAT